MSVLRYSAFTTPEGGGNPAGVVLDASAMAESDMLDLAARLGYSETAFVTENAPGAYSIRYFSPEREVDFCGHATVAAAVALAESQGVTGDLDFNSPVGPIPVSVEAVGGGLSATLTSIAPEVKNLDAEKELLDLVGWAQDDVDPHLPSGLAFAGIWHPIIWAGSRERLSRLTYDFDALKSLMLHNGWGTVSLLYRESDTLIHSRNAFPIGGVVEDPATGAAAAALGGFLRAHGLLPRDGRFLIRQGEDMGQPCLLAVDARGDRGIRVSGTAIALKS